MSKKTQSVEKNGLNQKVKLIEKKFIKICLLKLSKSLMMVLALQM